MSLLQRRVSFQNTNYKKLLRSISAAFKHNSDNRVMIFSDAHKTKCYTTMNNSTFQSTLDRDRVTIHKASFEQEKGFSFIAVNDHSIS